MTALHLDDDEPITLAEACKLFPRAKLTVWTLRAEAQRGRLDIFRLGKRDCTTPASLREMVKRCQEENRRRASTSMSRATSGSSAMERTHAALAAANETLRKLKAS
jgi:hypothetical protein